ncbi:hypothetical protein RJ639_024208 [Escallonia herrerae]|uniref:Major facilitator superfamily (MFS) profile domain-containing protein n=1 Tax=Escallonia herrerae TaxID=1293975 RepID=A0AA88UYE3_9ASTE|nr:hypothetical protein RJ639_024208 [Escallonia herrerae]
MNQVYIASYITGIAGIPWVIMAEIFPINIKGTGGSLATFVYWFRSWDVSYIFSFLLDWSSAGVFFNFASIYGLSILFVAKLGKPRQHVAHFIKTFNDAGTEKDLLVKQFVQSLKGNAFNWYTDLEPELIDCWEEMEREFQNCFYSTHRSVSMMELTNTKQRKEEPVVDYIKRWQALSLDCKERLSGAPIHFTR